jgi:hypothetical protein
MVSSADIRTSVFARLDDQLDVGVYTYVPADAVYPYVRLDGLSALNADTKTETITEFTIDVHAFDKDEGSSLPVENIADAVKAALHHHDLVVSGGSTIQCRWQSQLTIQQGQPNDRYWHAVCTFEIIVEDV